VVLWLLVFTLTGVAKRFTWGSSRLGVANRGGWGNASVDWLITSLLGGIFRHILGRI